MTTMRNWLNSSHLNVEGKFIGNSCFITPELKFMASINFEKNAWNIWEELKVHVEFWGGDTKHVPSIRSVLESGAYVFMRMEEASIRGTRLFQRFKITYSYDKGELFRSGEIVFKTMPCLIVSGEPESSVIFPEVLYQSLLREFDKAAMRLERKWSKRNPSFLWGLKETISAPTRAIVCTHI